MAAILPSSSVAAIGRHSLLLHLPPASRCSIYLVLQSHCLRETVVHPQVRFASTQVRKVISVGPSHGRRLQSPTFAPREQAASLQNALSDNTASSKVASINPYDFTDKINPPSTTLPVPINLPSRQSSTGAFRYYISVGKAYWAFYKAGIKNVWRNAQERRRLVRRKRAEKHSAPPSMPDTKENVVLDERALGQYANYPFTRAEFQFFIRSWRDAKKIPIFLVLLGIFGEYLPLVVMVCTPLVPYTCRIPKQVRKARETIEERRSRSFRGDMGTVPTPLKRGTDEVVRSVTDLDKVQIQHIARSLGLYFKFWESLGPLWPPTFVLRKRVEKRLQYLELDDALLKRDGGTRLLKGEEEIKIAAEDRGIDVLNRKPHELHQILAAWEHGADQGKTLSMLLSRPSAWNAEASS
ncbi:uncharacterized protein PV09_05827 [Verruconis gallopava]|uniref:Letm1 RBD domain-containing protein n=1 Tax=Verruconis gallopava TaxID=253628 RepID=A0A0D1YQ76_9PEZI|nr:uncharacterized protein PV09_05827 [Verruconis gallopava]KIW02762.1 hypothetical protein PV09_05827 [Verruconis gallopava]